MSIQHASPEGRICAIEELLGAGKAVPEDDVIWLCRRLRGFAIPRPDEFDFPEFCGLIGRDKKRSVSVRQLRRLRVVNEILAGEAHDLVALDYTADVPPTDALAVVRPWVKAYVPEDDMRLEGLRRFQLKCRVDGKVVADAPLGEFLMASGGIGLQTTQPKVIVSQDLELVLAAILDETYTTVRPSEAFGVALLNGQRLTVTLESADRRLIRTVDMLAGITVAQYTSRSAVNGHTTNLEPIL